MGGLIINREETQAQITGDHVVLVGDLDSTQSSLVDGFLGQRLSYRDLIGGSNLISGKTVFLAGDISEAARLGDELASADAVFVVRELVTGHGDQNRWPLIGVGQLPILVHRLGVLFPRYFEDSDDYFTRIASQHNFQSLTESTKPGAAHRSGIYLTPVSGGSNEVSFNLLRCSTNFSGPTDNFRSTDWQIVNSLNGDFVRIIENPAPLNHVLAQIYHNNMSADGRQTKARIKAHSDKTKDMPPNGLIAFCTFYDQLEKLDPIDGSFYDYGQGAESGLTRLHFRLKKSVASASHDGPEHFTVTLFPNSVFVIPLSTNRSYTHAIQVPSINADKLPTRMGYVIRCSSTEAVHKDGQTSIRRDSELFPLEPPTAQGLDDLRSLYAAENRSDQAIDYGDRFPFSMNDGDYNVPEL